jgi:penicillin-binding protein 1A
LNTPVPERVSPLPPNRPRRRFGFGPLTAKERQAVKWSALVLLGAVALFLITLPSVKDLQKVAPGNAIQVFDRNNQLVVTIDGDEEREFVPLSSVPKSVQQAIMAAEDHDFYKHHGLSMKGITRAFVSNVSAGHVVEGGSTLTQQLAKNLFFDSADRSILRKIREAIIAVEIERSYTKNQIMEMYLNQVYFGRSAYGLERAARRYFGKSTAALTLGESAFLMGLVKAPSYLGEPEHVNEALERQQIVLDEMAELKYITPSEASAAKAAHLAFNRSNTRITKFPYYMSAVQQFLQANIDKKVLEKGGLSVYTNLDQGAQRLAEQTVARRVRSGGGGMNQAALVSVSVKDGSVVALVGGAGNYWDHQWNAATGPHPTGSSFKPFVYLTGFMQGKITPETMVDDSPIVIPQRGSPDWAPKNFDNEYYGPISIREAIALSRNVCAVRVAMACGIGNVMQTARDAGIKQAQLIPTPAMALGASAISPLEMAGAYATLARAGTYIAPQLVRRVDSRDGFSKDFQTLPQKVFPDFPVRQLVSCMESVVKEGTAVGAKLSDRPVAGKTGTTDNAKDLWFVGFTPDMVTAVWGGNDQHVSLGSATGGVMLTSIWKAYNQAYYRSHPTPAGSFYTEDTTNNNILQNILRNPADLLKSDEEKEKEAEEELNGKPEEQNADGQAPEQEHDGFQFFGAPNRDQQQQPQQQQGENEEEQVDGHPFMMRLPGAPQPGHVRRPMGPGSPNDPFAPQRFAQPDEGEQGPAVERDEAFPRPENRNYGNQEPPVAPDFRHAPAPRAVAPAERPEPRPEPEARPEPAEPQPAPEREEPEE